MNCLLLLLLGLRFKALWDLELNDVSLGARPMPGTDQNDQNTQENEMHRIAEEVVENINHFLVTSTSSPLSVSFMDVTFPMIRSAL